MIRSPGAVRGRTMTLNNGDRLREVVRLAATRAGWGAPFARARDGRRWGRGIACNAYHGQTMVAQVADVSVGASGDLKVHRVVCAVDCGEVVDVAGLEAQFQSGVAWALSALRTQVTFERGRARQSGFGDLPVLRIGDMPVVELHAVRNELPPFGAGEQPVPAVWPAVMNAYFDATGVRVRRLPFTA